MKEEQKQIIELIVKEFNIQNKTTISEKNVKVIQKVNYAIELHIETQKYTFLTSFFVHQVSLYMSMSMIRLSPSENSFYIAFTGSTNHKIHPKD